MIGGLHRGTLLFIILFVSCGAAHAPKPRCQAVPTAPPIKRFEPLWEQASSSKAKPKVREPSSEPALTIVIDPGHGGEDLGAKSTVRPIYSEKNFNLVTARFLQEYLEQLGYHTVMTRDKDVFVALSKRAAVATDQTHEIFVSVHFNAAESAAAEGIEVFYFDDKQDATRTAKSKSLARTVLTKVINATQAKSRGTKHGNYHVIRETAVPAILIEGGFLTHPEELSKIKNPVYLKKLAWGAAHGIHDYARTKK